MLVEDTAKNIDNWKSKLEVKKNNFSKKMKLQSAKKHKFKAVPKFMIYDDPVDKETQFLTLMNYYTDDSELKRVKENKYNSKYDKFVIYGQAHKKCT